MFVISTLQSERCLSNKAPPLLNSLRIQTPALLPIRGDISPSSHHIHNLPLLLQLLRNILIELHFHKAVNHGMSTQSRATVIEARRSPSPLSLNIPLPPGTITANLPVLNRSRRRSLKSLMVAATLVPHTLTTDPPLISILLVVAAKVALSACLSCREVAVVGLSWPCILATGMGAHFAVLDTLSTSISGHFTTVGDVAAVAVAGFAEALVSSGVRRHLYPGLNGLLRVQG